MKNNIFFTLLVALFLMAIGCNRDEIQFETPSQNLAFSKDTLVLDTVYNQVRSETYAVKVYNKENKDIKIPKIHLEGGANSPYRLNVDGKTGTEFTNVPLRKKDSLYIFVEIAPIATETEAVVEDKIIFSTNQKVTLLSVVQDAEFFIQTSDNPNIITQNTTWTNQRAKIIYGDLTVAEGKTLTIEKGTKIYFAKNGGLKLSKSSQLNVNGDLGAEVIFRGERNDPRYDTIPANWKSIKMEEGARAKINYARIFGGTNGLEINQSELEISNSIIHTFQEFGIKSIHSKISAENLVMNHCGNASFGIFKGGNINLNHCTLANYWAMNSSMSALALFASNEWNNGEKEYAALTLNIQNSILYTRNSNAVSLKPTNGQVFNYQFINSLIKYDNFSDFSFDNNPKIINSIKNEDPKFINFYASKMNLRVAEDSPTRGKANSTYAQQTPLDIVKNSRTSNPTIGAYQ